MLHTHLILCFSHTLTRQRLNSHRFRAVAMAESCAIDSAALVVDVQAPQQQQQQPAPAGHTVHRRHPGKLFAVAVAVHRTADVAVMIVRRDLEH